MEQMLEDIENFKTNAKKSKTFTHAAFFNTAFQ